jgi:hypothetical protein
MKIWIANQEVQQATRSLCNARDKAKASAALAFDAMWRREISRWGRHKNGERKTRERAYVSAFVLAETKREQEAYENAMKRQKEQETRP